MENLSEILAKKVFTVKPAEEWRELGLELEKYYGKGIWRVVKKVGVMQGKLSNKLRDAHKIAMERGITKLPYLLGILKKLK